jgi:hypothetical protein
VAEMFRVVRRVEETGNVTELVDIRSWKTDDDDE